MIKTLTSYMMIWLLTTWMRINISQRNKPVISLKDYDIFNQLQKSKRGKSMHAKTEVKLKEKYRSSVVDAEIPKLVNNFSGADVKNNKDLSLRTRNIKDLNAFHLNDLSPIQDRTPKNKDLNPEIK